jgi:hypothetical protein
VVVVVLETLVDIVVRVGLILKSKSFLEVLLVPVSAKYNETIRYTVEWMLHYKLVELNRGSHLSLFRVLKEHDSFLGLALIALQLKNFSVSDQSFLGLLAFFIQNSEIEPNLV